MPEPGGIVFLVVGASGAGKDTLIDGLRHEPSLQGNCVFARRVITRPSGSPGEEHDGAGVEEFIVREAAGDFLISWEAHGLHYGLPARLLGDLAKGCNVIANGSRSTVHALAMKVPALVVIEITAPADALAARIASRSRENAAEREQRLARPAPPMPDGIPIFSVENSGSVDEGVDKLVEILASFRGLQRTQRMDFEPPEAAIFLAADGAADAKPTADVGELILPYRQGGIRRKVRLIRCADPLTLPVGRLGIPASLMRALGVAEGEPLMLRRIPAPREKASLRRKIHGGALSEPEYRRLLGEIVEGRYEERELAPFLVAVTQHLQDSEVLAIAKARTALARQIRWADDIVVDKHSLGGVPGSRITLIVVPIVAAHGLAIPKTSSRAITSAAGTADVMEILARVDLTRAEVERCVREVRACICWNGRLNHSVLDDLMNAITRPLELQSSRWSVASILSKKKTAGATHVIIDIPWGPKTKQRTLADAQALAALFESVGAGLGMRVKALPTDGRQPIGSGIGPALEIRDVMQVLNNDPGASPALREKALIFAGHILAWDPLVATLSRGIELAKHLLVTGSAKRSLEAIAKAQGEQESLLSPGACVGMVKTPSAGRVTDIDGWKISGIARAAGAPDDKSAGVDLLCRPGAVMRQDDPVYRIHASNSYGLAAGLAMTRPGGSFHGAIAVEPL